MPVSDAPRRNLRWMALGAGVVMGAGPAPLSLWFVALPACAVLLWVLGQGRSVRHAAGLGWSGGLGYISATHFWIVEPFFVDPWSTGWMAPFALIGLASGLALIWSAAAALAFRVGSGPRLRALALVPALTLAEMSRAYLFTGFPWSPIGTLLLETPVAQLAALGGVHGLTFFALAVLGVPLALSGRGRVAAAGLSIAVVAAAWTWGAGRIAATPAETSSIVRIVQPNAAQELKWDPQYIPVFFNRALEMTAARDGDAAPDMIVWPETSVPTLLGYADSMTDAMRDAAGGAPLIFGVQRRDDLSYFNSLAVIGPGAGFPQVYDKRHLVPFGEYVPFGDLLTRVGIGSFASTRGYGFAPGPEGQPLLDMGALGKGLPLICYEGIFPQDLRSFPGRADWIVLITNDAWFGTLAMPQSHLDHARMRAIENGLPLIRSANTGISAMIDASGQVTARLGLNETGYLDAALPGARAETPYARLGDWPVLLLALLGLTGTGLARLRIDGGARAA